MSTGPLRRSIGILGLLALVPVLLQLVAGVITPEDAAIRGGVIAVVVVALGRLACAMLTSLARRFERRSTGDAEPPGAASGQPAGDRSH